MPKEISHIPGEGKSEIVFDFLESLEARTTVDHSKHEITRDLVFLLHKTNRGKIYLEEILFKSCWLAVSACSCIFKSSFQVSVFMQTTK